MKTLVVAAALIIKGGRILVAQREESDEWGLYWEFPGGTLEEDEGPQDCIKRELREELGIEVEAKEICEAVFNILLLAYLCTITEGTPSAIRCREVRWVGKDELKGLPMPPADEEMRATIPQKGLWDSDAA
jgi:8-oxo-dGTP diphosphatase